MAGVVSPILRGWEHLGVGESLHFDGTKTRGPVQLAVAALNRSVRPKNDYKYFATPDGCRVCRMR